MKNIIIFLILFLSCSSCARKVRDFSELEGSFELPAYTLQYGNRVVKRPISIPIRIHLRARDGYGEECEGYQIEGSCVFFKDQQILLIENHYFDSLNNIWMVHPDLDLWLTREWLFEGSWKLKVRGKDRLEIIEPIEARWFCKNRLNMVEIANPHKKAYFKRIKHK